MSKKHPNRESLVSGAVASLGHASEYKIIKHDLVRVVVLNALYLIVILAVYFTNTKSHYLERWAAQLFNF